MKYLICILFCFLFVNLAISQNSNADRLKELPALIDEAANNKNYELALKLEDELAIREKLQEAIDEEDYERATELREDLYALENGEYKRSESNEVDVAKNDGEHGNSKQNAVFYLDFAFLGLNNYQNTTIDIVDSYDQNGNYIGSKEKTVITNRSMFGLNFKLGHKFYMGPGDRKLRVGLDINYLTLNVGISLDDDFVLPNLAFTTPCPGFVATYHFSETMGLDLQANTGVVFTLTEFNEYPIPIPGFIVNPQARFWYKNVGIGLQYTYYKVNSRETIRNLRMNHFGLFFGVRF